MDKEAKSDVEFKIKAEESIVAIASYIAGKGYPETALKFKEELYTFSRSLTNFPLKYPICRNPRLQIRKLHCGVFNKNDIFVYKIAEKRVIIYNIIHSHTNPDLYTV